MDQDWEGISSSLEEIRTSLLSKNGCIVNMTADGKSLTSTEKYVGKFLDSLPEKPSGGQATWDARLPLRNEAFVIPTQVKKNENPSAYSVSFGVYFLICAFSNR